MYPTNHHFGVHMFPQGLNLDEFGTKYLPKNGGSAEVLGSCVAIGGAVASFLSRVRTELVFNMHLGSSGRSHKQNHYLLLLVRLRLSDDTRNPRESIQRSLLDGMLQGEVQNKFYCVHHCFHMMSKRTIVYDKPYQR